MSLGGGWQKRAEAVADEIEELTGERPDDPPESIRRHPVDTHVASQIIEASDDHDRESALRLATAAHDAYDVRNGYRQQRRKWNSYKKRFEEASGKSFETALEAVSQSVVWRFVWP